LASQPEEPGINVLIASESGFWD